MPFRSRNALTLTSCDLIVSLSTVACWAMVAPPRKTTPDSRPASTRQTMASRSACGSLTTRPSSLVMALSATPSSMPAKIRNSVAAKYQVNSSSAANADDADAADRYRPCQIVAGLKTIVSRDCHVDSFSVRSTALFRQNAPGIKPMPRRFDAGIAAPRGGQRRWTESPQSIAAVRSDMLIRRRCRHDRPISRAYEIGKPCNEEAGGRCDRKCLSHRKSI